MVLDAPPEHGPHIAHAPHPCYHLLSACLRIMIPHVPTSAGRALYQQEDHVIEQTIAAPASPPSVEAAIEELYLRHGKALLNYMYRMLSGRQDAEEAVQDTFAKAYRAYDRLPDDANVRAWLYRIATNTAYDKLRRRKLIQWLPLQDNDRGKTALDRPEEVAVTRRDVRAALDALPPTHRAPLVLYTIEGYTTEQIAQMLGISQSAVKKRLVRARVRFREVYGDDG